MEEERKHSARLKVLFINSKTLLPNIDGATIRSTQMLRMLAETCDVDVVYTCNVKLKPDDLSPLTEYCQHVQGFYTTTIGMIVKGLLGIFKSKPLQCSYFYSEEAQRYIDEHIQNYDFVFCNNVRAAQYVVGRPCRKIIDYVDALSLRYEKEGVKADVIRKIVFAIEAKRLRRYEQEILRSFDGHFIISDIDRQHILNGAGVTDKEIYVVNNSTDMNRPIEQNDRQDIVFVGSMYYEPNIVAVRAFVESVFPLVKKECRSARFFIVGTRPARSVRRLASQDVIVTGYVDDPKEYLRKATVVVVPMISGAGVQNKILEAMSMACCVVTTPIGAEGLDNIVNGRDIIVTSSPSEMAQEIIILLHSKESRTTIGLNGRKYIEDNLTYSIIADRFNKYLGMILSA